LLALIIANFDANKIIDGFVKCYTNKLSIRDWFYYIDFKLGEKEDGKYSLVKYDRI